RGSRPSARTLCDPARHQRGPRTRNPGAGGPEGSRRDDLHGTAITIVGRDPSFKPVVNYSINQSDGLTAVSDYLRRETYFRFEISRDIAVIPNFIDTERFARLDKDHFKKAIFPDGERVLAHVSNFRP